MNFLIFGGVLRWPAYLRGQDTYRSRYIEEILVEDIAKIYIKEVFIRYRALIKIILDRDLRFIVVF